MVPGGSAHKWNWEFDSSLFLLKLIMVSVLKIRPPSFGSGSFLLARTGSSYLPQASKQAGTYLTDTGINIKSQYKTKCKLSKLDFDETLGSKGLRVWLAGTKSSILRTIAQAHPP